MPENFRIGKDPDAALQAIQAAYAAQLPQRLQDIGACVRQCLEEPGIAAHYDLLSMQLHRLSGSAGTFGFAELGQRATRLEMLLSSFLNDKAGGDFAPVAADITDMLRWAAAQNSSQLAPGRTL